jgi:hypothetical protein
MDAEDDVRQKIIQHIREGNIKYQCIFCKEVIDGEVCGVVVIRNWNRPPEEQAEQLFFSHKECFEKASGEIVEAEPDEEDPSTH